MPPVPQPGLQGLEEPVQHARIFRHPPEYGAGAHFDAVIRLDSQLANRLILTCLQPGLVHPEAVGMLEQVQEAVSMPR